VTTTVKKSNKSYFKWKERKSRHSTNQIQRCQYCRWLNLLLAPQNRRELFIYVRGTRTVRCPTVNTNALIFHWDWDRVLIIVAHCCGSYSQKCCVM